jgi:hypothetical protein
MSPKTILRNFLSPSMTTIAYNRLLIHGVSSILHRTYHNHHDISCSSEALLLSLVKLNNVWSVKGVKRLKFSTAVEEDPSLDEVWQCLCELVFHVCTCWDSKYIVEFFQRALFSFWDEEENHDQSDDIEATIHKPVSMIRQWQRKDNLRIEAEGADNSEGVE